MSILRMCDRNEFFCFFGEAFFVEFLGLVRIVT